MKSKESVIFICINVFVAFLGFVRSFAFMKFFNFRELGIITLVNTAAMLVGFFQLGLINGGYRIIALREEKSNIKTNNVVFSYFLIISAFLFVASVLGYVLDFFKDWLLVLIIITIGICMLITNWLTNTLIGASEFRKLNIANLTSSLSSLLCLVFAYFFGLYGALFSLLIQPLLFVLIVSFTSKNLIPTKFDFDISHIRYILSFGFVPFLSGIFFLVYMQIERWSINSFLGPEALGKMYLIFLIVSLWVLIPTSVLNLFFPKAIKLYTDRDILGFNNTIKLNGKIILGYTLIITVLVVFLLNTIVSVIFPKHQPYVYLVILGLPGLILRSFIDPISLYLNSIVSLKPIFWSDILALFVYISSVFIFFIFNLLSLSTFVICFNIYFAFKFLYLLFSYFKIKSKQ